jgi:hypothetical protein
MSQVENVPLSKIKDNPWRDRVRNPIDTDRVEAIATSIEKTKKYWIGTYGRKTAKGFVELAFGHHRYEAAKAQGLKEIPIIIEEFTDGEMLVWMAQENVGGGLPVVVEAVFAAVKALGEGKIEVDMPSPDTRKDVIRYAPSFVIKGPSPTVGERAYTMDTLARYLGFIKKSTNRAKDSVVAAMGILERAEVARAEKVDDSEARAAALEKSLSSMTVRKAVEAVSGIKQREEQVKARTEEAKKAAKEFDAEQRSIQAARKAEEEKAEAERQKLVKQLAAAKKEEDDKRALEIKERLAEKEKEDAKRDEEFVVKNLALEVKLEENKKREAEAKKEDEYLPIRREVERILHKLEGSTATTKEALAEEIKGLTRKSLTLRDRDRLREEAQKMGDWYSGWVADQLLPPLSVQKTLANYRSRAESERRAKEAKAVEKAAKKEKAK